MKLLLFSGTHSRHFYVNKKALENCDESLVIVMKREEVVPEPPQGISNHDRELFVRHFAARSAVEQEVYGDIDLQAEAGDKHRFIFIEPSELNTSTLAGVIRDFNADLCFIFGCDIIKNPVFDALPTDKVNLHLGLSPWYRGGATLFWPFYFLQPQFAGVTFHQISDKADAGDIVHQCVPTIERGDSIHRVGAKCVVKARDDLSALFSEFKKRGNLKGLPQRTSGRVWRGIDFEPSHLRVIYDLCDDKVVDKYLDNELGSRAPILRSIL